MHIRIRIGKKKMEKNIVFCWNDSMGRDVRCGDKVF